MRRQSRRVALDIAKVRASGNRVTRADLDRWLVGLSIPVRKVRVRDAARNARRTSVRELDAMCRALVFARDGNKCRNCGRSEGLLDWAHVLSRRHPKTRHDPANSLVLCRACHMAFHDRPVEGAAMIASVLGHRHYDILKARATGPGKANHELTRLHLEQEAKKLGIA